MKPREESWHGGERRTSGLSLEAAEDAPQGRVPGRRRRLTGTGPREHLDQAPVQRPRPHLRSAVVRLWGRRYAALYLGLALAFAVAIGRSYDRQTGFTSSETFGERFRARRLPRLHDVPIYTYRGDGYDG